MATSRRALSVALLAVAALSPRAARADSKGWTLCIPGSFHSCHSIQINTTPVFNSSSVRIGTAVTFTLRNLQGTALGAALLDNAPWSVLNWVAFNGPITNGGNTAWAPGTPSGAATGSGNLLYFDGGIYGGAGAGVRGCAAAPPGTDWNFSTCGGSVSFSLATCNSVPSCPVPWASPAIFDASGFTSVFITANVPGGLESCTTAGGTRTPACDNVQLLTETTTAPEPVSVALLGTGLLGLGGVQWRRKRRGAGSA